MANQKVAKPDAKQIAQSEDLWARFTVFMKWSTISVVAILAIMAAVFIR